MGVAKQKWVWLQKFSPGEDRGWREKDGRKERKGKEEEMDY
jgi:hypothetical protein